MLQLPRKVSISAALLQQTIGLYYVHQDVPLAGRVERALRIGALELRHVVAVLRAAELSSLDATELAGLFEVLEETCQAEPRTVAPHRLSKPSCC